jgi:AraC-like DNA-binding protein
LQPEAAARHLRAWRIIERRVSNPKNRAVSIAQLCRAAKVSPRTLYTVCREFSGMSAKAYITRKRMQIAFEMLLRVRPGQITVAKVAISCGFDHAGRFADTFRRHHGKLPSRILHRTSGRRSSRH